MWDDMLCSAADCLEGLLPRPDSFLPKKKKIQNKPTRFYGMGKFNAEAPEPHKSLATKAKVMVWFIVETCSYFLQDLSCTLITSARQRFFLKLHHIGKEKVNESSNSAGSKNHLWASCRVFKILISVDWSVGKENGVCFVPHPRFACSAFAHFSCIIWNLSLFWFPLDKELDLA